MGFKKVILPKTQGKKFIEKKNPELENGSGKMQIIPAKNISEAIDAYS